MTCPAEKARLRVLVVIDSLGFGGAEQALVTLLPALKERDVLLEVVALWPPVPLAPDLEAAGIPVHQLHGSHRWALPEVLMGLERLVARVQPSVVWGHLYFGTLYTRLLKLRHPRLVVVSSLHSLTYAQYPPRTPWHQARAWLDGVSGRHLTNRIVAVSQAVADDYAHYLGWTDIQVIPNPVPTPDRGHLPASQRASIRLRYGVPEDAFLLVLPARYSVEKGHAVLLRAMHVLRERRPLIHLVAPGQGPLLPGLRDLAYALQLEQVTHFVDPLPQPDLFDLLRAADAVATPSLFEGFGIAAGEAMALGVPVVATRVGGFLDLVQHERTGLLVPPADAEALAAAIARVHGDPALRARLGEQARARVAQGFSVTRVAARWDEQLRLAARLAAEPQR